MARRVVASCVDLSDKTRFEVHIIIQLSYDLSDSKTIVRPDILTLTSMSWQFSSRDFACLNFNSFPHNPLFTSLFLPSFLTIP